jgi:hypothetical protein
MRIQGFIALCGVLLLAGCASMRHKEKKQPPPPPSPTAIGPQRVGRVALVNEDLGFVLVDVGSLYTPQAGQALKSFRDGIETGVLAVSPEKQRPFIVGDIIKGTPEVGDDVEQ